MKYFLLPAAVLVTALLSACSPNPPQVPEPSQSRLPQSAATLSSASSSSEESSRAAVPILNFDAEPIDVQVGTGGLAISKEPVPALQKIATEDQMQERAQYKCGTVLPPDLVENARNKYEGVTGLFYTIERQKDQVSIYYLEALPNKLPGASKKRIQDLFEYACGVGDTSLIMMNRDWLVFGGDACGGTGLDDGGVLCNTVSRSVAKTLRIRQQ